MIGNFVAFSGHAPPCPPIIIASLICTRIAQDERCDGEGADSRQRGERSGASIGHLPPGRKQPDVVQARGCSPLRTNARFRSIWPPGGSKHRRGASTYRRIVICSVRWDLK